MMRAVSSSTPGAQPGPTLPSGRELVSEPLQGASRAVLHAAEAATRPEVPPAVGEASCARCGGPIPVGPSGRPRRGTRYCSSRCRFAATRERRAAARAELVQARTDRQRALAALSDASQREEVALRVLGFNPDPGQQRRVRKVSP
jgi:hypothetical protein